MQRAHTYVEIHLDDRSSGYIWETSNFSEGTCTILCAPAPLIAAPGSKPLARALYSIQADYHQMIHVPNKTALTGENPVPAKGSIQMLQLE